MKKEFIAVFQLSKKRLFYVDYYTLLSNQTPYFSTAAAEFNQPKTDWARCGQAQECLLPPFPAAYKFYKKWDPMHLRDLSDAQYSEMLKDMLVLCKTYNHMLIELDESTKPYNPRFHFDDLKEWSKQTPKKVE